MCVFTSSHLRMDALANEISRWQTRPRFRSGTKSNAGCSTFNATYNDDNAVCSGHTAGWTPQSTKTRWTMIAYIAITDIDASIPPPGLPRSSRWRDSSPTAIVVVSITTTFHAIDSATNVHNSSSGYGVDIMMLGSMWTWGRFSAEVAGGRGNMSARTKRGTRADLDYFRNLSRGYTHSHPTKCM